MRINARIRRITLGNMGDCKPIGDGMHEARIHCGPGYRLYFIRTEATTIVLLCGGDKSSQQQDIIRAQTIANQWRKTQ